MSKEDALSVNGTGDIFTNKQPTFQIEHRKPEEYKVHIWGYELCKGAEWQDFLDVVNKLGKEKADLEAKLAESEEKNLKLREKYIGLINMNVQEFNKLGKEIEKHNQDKISFCIEQLRQIKKLCEEKFDWWENSEWEGDIYDKSDVSNAYFDIEANIDELIEQLTHQHEDKGE